MRNDKIDVKTATTKMKYMYYSTSNKPTVQLNHWHKTNTMRFLDRGSYTNWRAVEALLSVKTVPVQIFIPVQLANLTVEGKTDLCYTYAVIKVF